MEIELNTLLVALMFVTILVMGIGNILMVLADVINRATAARTFAACTACSTRWASPT